MLSDSVKFVDVVRRFGSAGFAIGGVHAPMLFVMTAWTI